MASELAGQPAPRELLINVESLLSAYYSQHPDPADPAQQVSFGTSGHRGTSLEGTFNEDHVLAISQALCEYRQTMGYSGPLFIGKDTHALSDPAETTAIEVFAANGVEIRYQAGRGFTPTPVVSHAILSYNHGRKTGLADGVVITPSHNPPDDGGFKYNPPSAGPADTITTRTIQDRANQIMRDGLKAVRRMPLQAALKASNVHEYDYIMPYVRDLGSVIDFKSIVDAKLKIGVDPLGGASVGFWQPIAETYGLNLDIVTQAPAATQRGADHRIDAGRRSGGRSLGWPVAIRRRRLRRPLVGPFDAAVVELAAGEVVELDDLEVR